ncbi:MAG: hypothetical protein KDD38_11370, partial [Bdellovibrionales bacterium]|nr:hypothetical protein [Bdellovibrionales bacterium]
MFKLIFSLILVFTIDASAAKKVPCKTLLQNTVQVGLSNYQLIGGLTLKYYLYKIESRIRKDAANNSQLILLPELTSLDLVDFTDEVNIVSQLDKIAKFATPKIVRHIKNLAKELNVYIILGGTPRSVDNKIYNSAVMAMPNGHVEYQEKIYLTPAEKSWSWTGGDKLKVFSTPLGKIVVLICYDSEFPSLSALLSAEMPDIILVPSMTDAPGFTRVRWSAQARAIEHKAFVIMNGVYSTDIPGWDLSAQAAVLSPADSQFEGIMAEGENYLTYILPLEQLRESRQLNEPYPAADETSLNKSVQVERVT